MSRPERVDRTYIVILACGHWFRESRPGLLKAPVDGEKRICAATGHYPRRTTAVYLAEVDSVRELAPALDLYPGSDREDAFRDWLGSRKIPATLGGMQQELAEAWKAALASVTPSDLEEAPL
ncbi:MAG TPA: hypothetical protein VGR71_16670 [Nitrospira sp.]|nr:hypothetical protein [Nitrospira sp.]